MTSTRGGHESETREVDDVLHGRSEWTVKDSGPVPDRHYGVGAARPVAEGVEPPPVCVGEVLQVGNLAAARWLAVMGLGARPRVRWHARRVHRASAIVISSTADEPS
jgi:hypothetical protein